MGKAHKVCALRAPDDAPAPSSDPSWDILISSVSERLAFERMVVRLYRALAPQLDAQGGYEGGPTGRELARIREIEEQHCVLLQRTLAALGQECPPSARHEEETSAEEARLPAALSDPRSSLINSLEAILVVELVDNDGWRALTGLLRAAGQAELAHECAQAMKAEDEHLAIVRRWVASARSVTQRVPARARARGDSERADRPGLVAFRGLRRR